MRTNSASYVRVSGANEGAADYFDGLALPVMDPATLQENHYDSWGLSLAGLDYRPLASKPSPSTSITTKRSKLIWAMCSTAGTGIPLKTKKCSVKHYIGSSNSE